MFMMRSSTSVPTRMVWSLFSAAASGASAFFTATAGAAAARGGASTAATGAGFTAGAAALALGAPCKLSNKASNSSSVMMPLLALATAGAAGAALFCVVRRSNIWSNSSSLMTSLVPLAGVVLASSIAATTSSNSPLSGAAASPAPKFPLANDRSSASSSGAACSGIAPARNASNIVRKVSRTRKNASMIRGVTAQVPLRNKSKTSSALCATSTKASRWRKPAPPLMV